MKYLQTFKLGQLVVTCLLSLVSLLGCTQPRDLHYYLMHPAETRTLYENCQNHPKRANTESCLLADKAYERLLKFEMHSAQEEQALGWDILQKQIKQQALQDKQLLLAQQLHEQQQIQPDNTIELASLHQQLKATKRALSVLTEDITLMLAVIRDRTTL